MNDTNPNRLFEIVFSFLEPTQAVGNIEASSEEEAINKLKHELEGRVENLRIINIKETTILPEGVTQADLSPDKILN